MTKTILLLLILLTSSFAHSEETLQAKFTQKISIGDGSVLHLDPRIVYKDSSYYLNMVGPDFNHWTPEGYCKLLYGEKSFSSWEMDLVASKSPGIPLINIDSQSNFMSANEKTEHLSVILTGVTCFNAEEAPVKKNYFFEVKKVEAGYAEITSNSYYVFPVTINADVFHGSHQIADLKKPQKMKFLFNDRTGNILCKLAGFSSVERIVDYINEPDRGIYVSTFSRPILDVIFLIKNTKRSLICKI